ncbi:MAG: hypothetical protein ACE5FH_04265 [Candidatus Zixiibacteriota bacterium]
MIIRSFTGETTAEALKKVRKELGGDAIVLKTRQLADQTAGHRFEITACLESKTGAAPAVQTDAKAAVSTEQDEPLLVSSAGKTSTVTQDGIAANLDVDKRLDRMQDRLDQLLSLSVHFPSSGYRPNEIQLLLARLIDADVSPSTAERFISRVSEACTGSEELIPTALDLLKQKLSNSVAGAITFSTGDRVLFLGAAGSGKSSVMGKLAARLVATEKKKIKLMSVDETKIGAHEEIGSYADILGVPLVSTEPSVRSDRVSDDIQLIDGPALDNDLNRVQSLKSAIASLRPNYRIAVYSALTRSSDTLAISEQLAEFDPTHMVMTKGDLTNRLGGLLCLAEAVSYPLAFVTNAPGGIGEVEPPDIEMVARKLLKMEPIDE